RRGAPREGPGLRGGRRGGRRARPADPLPPCPAQRPDVGHRSRAVQRRRQHRGAGVAGLPRVRRAAADAELGRADQAGPAELPGLAPGPVPAAGLGADFDPHRVHRRGGPRGPGPESLQQVSLMSPATPTPAQPLLSVRGLRTYFRVEGGLARAVDGVSFDVYPGEVLGLVGESGSGKTVTALSILRLIADPPGLI